MLYLIPAWYQEGSWSEDEQAWQERHTHTEFDDTVKQVQLFYRNKSFPFSIMLLSFAPNFRHFLHRQGVYHAPYWSCFDAIQGIRTKKASVLSFHNLAWPSGIEFIYTPFVVVAMQNGEKYAQIEFGEDGNPIRIQLYEGGMVCRQNIYDDRGFVSSTILYQSGEPFYQDYLTTDGVWKLRCFLADGHVEVNPQCPNYLLRRKDEERSMPFQRLLYGSLDQVISEVLSSYLRMTRRSDIFCVAMHKQHAALLENALRGRRMLLSFYENRFSVTAHPKACEMIAEAGCLVVDTRENKRRLLKEAKASMRRIVVISPYDFRVDSGISEQLTVQKILVPVDGLTEEAFSRLIRELGRYLLQNENAQVCLFTRIADYDRRDRLLERTRKELNKADLEEGWAVEEERNVSENKLDMEGDVKVRFFVEQCVDELAVSVCMREQRVLVDMREVPRLYLQIAALSMGIPQIVRTKTEFVEDGGNGILLKEEDDLCQALDYYLGGLANWNDARVMSYEIGKQYTTERLLKKWRGVLRSFGRDPYSPVRRG